MSKRVRDEFRLPTRVEIVDMSDSELATLKVELVGRVGSIDAQIQSDKLLPMHTEEDDDWTRRALGALARYRTALSTLKAVQKDRGGTGRTITTAVIALDTFHVFVGCSMRLLEAAEALAADALAETLVGDRWDAFYMAVDAMRTSLTVTEVGS